MKYINCYKSSRRLILNALFLFSPVLCFSQGYPIKLGIKVGWNYSNINAVDDVGEPSGYLSDGGEIYGGIALEKQFSEKSYIQSGFIASYTYVITFLEIPIFYKYIFIRTFQFSQVLN